MALEIILLETIGWVGLALVIGAFFMTDLKLLRIVSMVGALLMLCYYLIKMIPLAITTNAVIASINLYYLVKDRKK